MDSFFFVAARGSGAGSLLAGSSPRGRRVVDGGDSDHCSDSGGTSMPDVAVEPLGLGSHGEEGMRQGS